jgi:hypothetical protein
MSMLFGFSTAETADALALPYPRANALIGEAKARLNLEYLRIASIRRTGPAVYRGSFESGVADAFRLTQCYIDSSAARGPSPGGWKERFLESLRSLLSLFAATAWFAVPLFAVTAFSQLLFVRSFNDAPSALETRGPVEHALIHRLRFQGALRI